MKHQPRLHSRSSPPRLRRLLAATSLLGLTLTAGHALAQADILPPPPDVMLLVDTSGSMDYKTSSNAFPTCRYSGVTDTGATSERSRWIDLVEVLTGSINNYDCQRLDRGSANFKSEYGLSGGNPYDYLYTNPYNRPASNGCVAGPGALSLVNPALFPPGAIKFHPTDNALATCTNFDQASDGIMDSFVNDVRFGLMTFDTEPNAAKDVTGLWSYYLGSPVMGEPAGCIVPQPQEVGVRNSSAPPWEGRAVGFGNPATGSSLDQKTRNDMIQKVLLTTRPYGATPIAGMLDDARNYFLNDTSADPLDSSFSFGPQSDPAISCRHKAIVLLSDGQPNMDLRPFCEPAGCPYLKPEDIAQDLKSKGIPIYVIGFALSNVTLGGVSTPCSSDFFNPSLAVNVCKANVGDPNIQACCSLNAIAAAGGPTWSGAADEKNWSIAHFADSRDKLRSELSQAIGSNFKSTTRTPFVNAAGSGFTSASTDLKFAVSFRFAAAFKPGKLDKPWIGELNRGRYTCDPPPGGGAPVPTLHDPDPALGDKFVDNVNAGGPNARQIFSVIGNAPVASGSSMRPNLPVGVADGVGTYAGTMNAAPEGSATFVSTTTPQAINVDNSTCAGLNATQCRDLRLKWLVGIEDTSQVNNRCVSGACDLVSEIFHSVPRAVAGRPSQFLVDASYQKFVTDELAAKRPSVLYASSNDGFLHAFKIVRVDLANGSEPMQVNKLESNELWTFLPPAVLPNLPSLYPASHQLLLDGTPAIKEVVATADSSLSTYKFRLERTRDQARGGTGEWRNILVQSFGTAHPGYFAIDVTDPVPTGSGGPKFLWQLVNDSAGNPLFGSGGGTPLITTVFLGGTEIAVAVLPGGYGSVGHDAAAGTNTGCVRSNTSGWPSSVGTEVVAPRTSIPCYDGTAIQARSLTVVRLDTGEILRTFRQAENEVPGLVGKGVFTQAFVDSPMTGQPVAYPADVGAVADRVFIGDQDGTLWRLNLASDSGVPSDWKLELFFDGFPKSGGAGASPFSHTWRDGQPIIATPIISVNQLGNLTIAFSTGEQEAIGSLAGLANYVWSLTEFPSADRTLLSAKINWHLDLKDSLSGDRVIGEMALFASDLFFATVGPGPQNDPCSSGSGKVWGMHYTDNTGVTAGKGGIVSPTLATLVSGGGFIDATTLLGSDAHAYLSGVSVAQQPTCDTSSTSGDDGFFNYGAQPSTGAVTPGKYQLIIPTGDKVSSSTKSGLSVIKEGGSNGVAIDLKQPAVSLIVDSWASIVE